MSTNAPAWFSEMMKTKITQIRQARGKRLAGTTRRGDVKEKKVKFPIGGRGEAYKLTGAIQKVKPMNTGRSTVEVDMEDFEASDWVFTPDLEKMGPNELQQTASELSLAIARREDHIQWDATAAFAAANSDVIKVGDANTVITPQMTIATKAKLRAHGDNGAYDIFCPLPEMCFEQLMQYKEFSNAEWRGGDDLPMLSMRDMEVRNHRGVIYFTMPDEYFKDAAGASIADTATDSYTYMWCSDALGVESNWDEQEPSFTQHADYEGSPWLGKVGMGGAAVGILGKGVARIQLKKLTDLVRPA